MELSASRSGRLVMAITYATETVTERETPARQCTTTAPPATRAPWMKSKHLAKCFRWSTSGESVASMHRCCSVCEPLYLLYATATVQLYE